MEVGGQLHAPATLPLGKGPKYSLGRRLGGPRTSMDMVQREKIPDCPGNQTLVIQLIA